MLAVAISLVALALSAIAHPLHARRTAHRRQSSLCQPSIPPSSSPKYVVAHVIVGNTEPYTVDDWSADILLANSSGINAFALNVGADSFQQQQVANAFTAAAQVAPSFLLFFSFDMSSLPCTTAADAVTLTTYVATYANHSSSLRYDGRVLASTFSGESCTFGQSSVPAGWANQFIAPLTGQNAVYFVPAFFIDTTDFSQFDNVMNGIINWNSAWPVSLTTASATTLLSPLNASLARPDQAAAKQLSTFVGANTTDLEYLAALPDLAPANLSYIPTVSPWFFTHYGPQSYNKNWIYLSDDHLYAKRWESVLSLRSSIDLVELLTWNDFGESHYLGPIEGAQPDSQAWVDGMDHTPWLNLTLYYATAFRTGSYPTPSQDTLWMWARTHPAAAQAPQDTVGEPANSQLTQDTLWAIVLLTAPANVTLSTAPYTNSSSSITLPVSSPTSPFSDTTAANASIIGLGGSSGSSTSTTFSLPAGLSKISVPLTPGGGMAGVITRWVSGNDDMVVDLELNGSTSAETAPTGTTTVLSLTPTAYYFNPSPTAYNFNAFVVGAST